MNIKLYIDEKIKYKYHTQSIQEFTKRLSRYCKLQLVTIRSVDDIPNKSYRFLINERGMSISSEAFSEKLKTLGVKGQSDLAFILLEDAEHNEHLSLTSMTMSTGLTVTALLEQIYRAYRIMRNEPYHK